MSINDVMKFGTNGMSKAEKAAEQDRRLKVVERINLLGNRIQAFHAAEAAAQAADAKKLKGKARQCAKEISRIKGEESCWLKEAAWFMYC